MLRGVFVTGTDTGVGKTIVSAALLHRYANGLAGPPLLYWKPIQTGIEQDDDTETVRRLGPGDFVHTFDRGIRLPRPVSPHLAARLAGQRIDLEALRATAEECPRPGACIVEGAGGVLVPVNESALMADVMKLLALPVLVVARSTLGTINHTLLTLEALRARALDIAGVVMVGPPDAANREAIETFGGVAVVGALPPLDPLTAASLAGPAALLDASGRLEPLLR